MALVQINEMRKIVEGIVVAVRARAAELGITEGAVAICYNNCDQHDSLTGRTSCFDDLMPGEDRLRIFALKEGGTHIAHSKDGKEEAQCFGVVATKITAAAKAYKDTNGMCHTSDAAFNDDNIPGRQNWAGCVLYPVMFNHDLRGKIYVAVSGGSEAEDKLCALQAYEVIQEGLVACWTPSIMQKGIKEFTRECE